MGQEVRKKSHTKPPTVWRRPSVKIHWPCPASPPRTGWPGSAASSSCREGSSRSSWPAPPGSQTARCRSGTAAPPAWCGSAWSCPPLCEHRNRSSEPLPGAGYHFYTALVPSHPTPFITQPRPLTLTNNNSRIPPLLKRKMSSESLDGMDPNANTLLILDYSYPSLLCTSSPHPPHPTPASEKKSS